MAQQQQWSRDRNRTETLDVSINHAKCEWLREYDREGAEEARRDREQELPEEVEEWEGHQQRASNQLDIHTAWEGRAVWRGSEGAQAEQSGRPTPHNAVQ